MTKTAELRRAGVSDSGPPSTTDCKLTSSWKTFFFQDSSFTVMGTATKDALILFMFAETDKFISRILYFQNLPERKKKPQAVTLY